MAKKRYGKTPAMTTPPFKADPIGAGLNMLVQTRLRAEKVEA